MVALSKARIALLAAAFTLLGCAASCETISAIKSLSNWVQVTVEGIVTYVEPSECYIESADRSSGIRVIGPTVGIEIGDPVIAFGMFAVIDGEPAAVDASIYLHGSGSEIRPFGMASRAVGGASKWSPLCIWDYASVRVPSGNGWVWQRNWVPASGANNTGLLITTWGTIKATYLSPTTGASWFYIDDGSSLVSDLGDTGLLVYSDAQVEEGQFVSVTGISSVELSLDDASRLIRVIRTRSTEDVAILRQPPPEYPFSDYFNKPVLDHRWINLAHDDELSLTTIPGWLTLTPRPSWSLCELGQDLEGEWSLEVKMRLVFSDDPNILWQEAGMYVACQSDTLAFSVRRDGQEPTHVTVAGQAAGAMLGDTCWFRARMSGGVVTGSVSFDGRNYSSEYAVSVNPSYSLILFAREYCGWPPATPLEPFKVHFDYVRITIPEQEDRK